MPAVHGCAARLPCIVGRAISPAGEVCGGVMLRFCASSAPQSSVMPQDLGSLRRPGRILAGQGAAPLSRLTPTLPVCGARIALRVLKHTCVLRPLHLLRLAVSAAGGARLRSPLQGSLLGGSRLQSLPCKGRWMRRKAQTEGCIAALRRRYPAKPGRALAPCFVGDDACIVPESLRCRKAFAAGVNARPTLRPGTGGNAEAAVNRHAWRRDDAPIGPEPPQCHKAFAAGVPARPTLRAGTSGNAEAVVRRQARPRADASIGPYAGGGAGLAGRCQAPPPRRGTSRRRLAAAQGARRPAKRIVSLCAKDQPAADIAQPKSPLTARWARSFGPARRTPPPSGGGPGCRTPACGRR